MTMQLLDAPARLSEPRGPKILIYGPTAIGKTSLLKTLPQELLSTAILVDLESGDLPIADLPIASIRPRTWPDLRDLAVAIGGPNPAHATGAYSKDHYESVTAEPTLAGLARFDLVFVDSYTELSRRCRVWAEQQPESFNAYGKKDLRGTYGLVGRELIAWTQQLQHTRSRTILLTAILENITDEYWRLQLANSIGGPARKSRTSTGILDEIPDHELGDHQERQNHPRFRLSAERFVGLGTPRERPLRTARPDRRAQPGESLLSKAGDSPDSKRRVVDA